MKELAYEIAAGLTAGGFFFACGSGKSIILAVCMFVAALFFIRCAERARK